MNLLPDFFEEEPMTPPKELIENVIKELPGRTKRKVYAEVVVRKNSFSTVFETAGSKNEFNYSLRIRSHFLENYKFQILSFRHGIPFYPVILNLEETITQELGLPPGNIEISNEDELLRILVEAFNSEYLKKVIGTIMRMSKDEEIPF
jgi:hypothetical protein